MTVKLIDVAERAGVSKSTVSQYLNGRYKYMSEATKNKIEKVIEELDYQPNAIARSLKMKKTNTIGVIVSNIRSPFFAQAVRGIEKICLKKGYNVILCNTDNDSKKELDYLNMLKNKQVDGIIISYSGSNPDFMKDFIKSKVPIVVFDKDAYGLDVPIVVSENRNGAYKAISHFLDLGFKDIGVVSPNLKEIPSRVERVRGYKECLEDNGIDYDDKKVFYFDETLDLIPQMEGLFAKSRMPKAIFSCNHQSTMAFLLYCKKNNIRIPEDLAFIGFDDIPQVELFDVPVTVISQKDYDIGYRSAQILFEKIESKSELASVKEIFPCELIVRKSCGSKM